MIAVAAPAIRLKVSGAQEQKAAPRIGAVAAIAQLGERQTEDLKVPVSIPELGIARRQQRGGWAGRGVDGGVCGCVGCMPYVLACIYALSCMYALYCACASSNVCYSRPHQKNDIGEARSTHT